MEAELVQQNCDCSASNFIQNNEAFLLTAIASVSAAFGLLLSTCIKSRCTEIKCCGLTCIRNPLPAEAIEMETTTTTQNNP